MIEELKKNVAEEKDEIRSNNGGNRCQNMEFRSKKR